MFHAVSNRCAFTTIALHCKLHSAHEMNTTHIPDNAKQENEIPKNRDK